MSREKESSARKVKMTMGCTWKTLWKGRKIIGKQGWMSLALSSFLLYEKLRFSLYSSGVLTKGEAFSLPHFLTNFLPFSLLFSPGSYNSSPATCSSYSLRNVATYKR